MALVRLIDRLVIIVDALHSEDGRALRLTVGMLMLTVALFAVLALTVILARLGALP